MYPAMINLIYFFFQPGMVPCNDSVLSETIPDIAMATASVSQVRLHDEFELDIGDGASHPGTMYI